MRYALLYRASGAVAVVFVLTAMPLAAEAQHSPSLPSIGLPLPSIGLGPAPWEQRQLPAWERPQIPAWERKTLPPWEGGPRPGQKVDTGQRRHRRGVTPAVYYVPYAVEVPQAQPQVIVVQPAPVQIIKVEVPVPEPREEAPVAKAPEPPPYVPTGDRTLYVIPGCYVGNVPPQNLKLAAHCDMKKLTTYNP
jgi:hypothetical protein